MEIDESDSSDAEEQQPQSLTHQMVHFFYNRQAIAKDAWNTFFWNMFRVHHPDVKLDANALRSYFFRVVMRTVHELTDVPHAVVRYINPLFNQIREEVLEHGDLVEGTDYVYEQHEMDAPVVNNDELPPLRLRAGSAMRLLASRATKRYITPSPERIRNFVAAELSEILWTTDEQQTKVALDINECLLRVALLTKKNIPLINCVEPGMTCYDRLKRVGLIEGLLHDEEERNDTPQLTLPAASSTLIATPGCSRDYDSILKHVRSKPRKGAFIKHTMKLSSDNPSSLSDESK